MHYFIDLQILLFGMGPCFDLGLIRKRCQGGRFVIASRTPSAGSADPNPARPLRSPLLCREPARAGHRLLRAPGELSVVLGQKNPAREAGAFQERQRGEELRTPGWPKRSTQQHSDRQTPSKFSRKAGREKSLLRHLTDLFFQCKKPGTPAFL